MSLEQSLINARELVQKFDNAHLLINPLSLHDFRDSDSSGYVATFDFEETLQNQTDYDFWFEHADLFPRTARAATALEAIEKAIEKCELELAYINTPNCRVCKQPKLAMMNEFLCRDCGIEMADWVMQDFNQDSSTRTDAAGQLR